MSLTESTLPIRDDLRGQEPYGAPVQAVEACLNVNENPYPVSQPVIDSMLERIAQIAPHLNRYPDREHLALRDHLANYIRFESHYEPQRSQIWAANGSNEIMQELFLAFGGPGRTALSAEPTYSMYPQYARDTFTTWSTIPRADDFSIDVERLTTAITSIRPSIVVIANPNNPTGGFTPIEDIIAIAEHCQNVNIASAQHPMHPVLVVDEAYIEFRGSNEPSAVSLIDRFDHLVISRTMSKAFAFAGVRLGYCIAQNAIIDAIRIVRMPYHLSALTQAAAIAALEHAREQLKQVAHLRGLRDACAQWLTSLHYHGEPVQVAQSSSNFLMFGGHFEHRHEIFAKLLERGVLVREVGPDGWLRVCMGTDEHMQLFREALSAVLQEENDHWRMQTTHVLSNNGVETL